ncbi:MAG: FAD-dependent oxidoreductase, partial [Bacteroidota bacterium]
SGAQAPELTPIKNLRVTRQTIFWAKPKKNKEFDLGNFPCWTIADPAVSGFYYGFPALPDPFGEPLGLKFAHHTHGELSDPENINRNVTQDEQETLLSAIRKFLPDGIASISGTKTCMYTNSPDDHFILDFHPESEDVVMAAGFSGHGFKFASIVGEILSDLAMEGKTSQLIEFLSAHRFK